MSEPTDLRDARWRNLALADATGEDLSDDDRAFLASYEPRDPEAQLEQRVLASFATLGEQDDGAGRSDDAIVQGALADFDVHAPARVPTAPPRRRAWSAVAWIGGGVSLAAAAAFAFVIWTSGEVKDPPQPRDRVAKVDAPKDVETAPVVVEAASTGDTAPPPAAAPVVVRSGSFVDGDGHAVHVDAAADVGTLTATDAACLRAGDDDACFTAGSELTLSRDADEHQIALTSGRMQITSAAPTATTIVYRVAGDRIELATASVVVIEVTSATKWSIAVERGEARVIGTGGAGTTLKTGQSRTFGGREAPKLSAAQWLERARGLRGKGDIDGAIEAYEGLVENHPGAAASRTAMVTLGQLSLDRAQNKAALRWFDRYLGKGGPLAEDAEYGRIRALRGLGRSAQAQKATDDFLVRYPASSYAAKLRDR
jgi:hypothetical protein